jgi:hypothetical protein
MKRTTFIGSAGVSALAAYVPTIALAQTAQGMSNQNLRVARATIIGLIAQLQTEKADYAGERGVAIQKLQAAQAEIDAALEFRHAMVPTQAMSDAVLRHVEDRTEALISQLQGDKEDYAGHRVAAIGDLRAAADALNKALSVH